MSDPRATLVDSNVLLDLLTHDEQWLDWSSKALADAADAGPVVINPIVYAEVSVGFSRIEDLDEALPEDDFVRVPLPWSAGFLAGKCFLTRDAARYRTYFPTVHLIAPE